MATADYYLCDVCDGKAFYDANLDYDHDDPVLYGNGSRLGRVGDMRVICVNCAKTHKILVAKATGGE